MVIDMDKTIKKLLISAIVIFLLNIVIIASTGALMGINSNNGKAMTDDQMTRWFLYTFLPVIFLRYMLGVGILISNVLIVTFSLPIFNKVTNFKTPNRKLWTLIVIWFSAILPFSFANTIYILILRHKYKKTLKYPNVENAAIAN